MRNISHEVRGGWGFFLGDAEGNYEKNCSKATNRGASVAGWQDLPRCRYREELGYLKSAW